MSHFAHINNEQIVCSVIVISQETLDAAGGWRCPECRLFGAVSEWVQTSYNTKRGEHVLGGTPLRKNYAGVGYSYDKERDAFIPPKPFESWVLDEETCVYVAPTPCPKDGKGYMWKEEARAWVESNESKEANKVTPQ